MIHYYYYYFTGEALEGIFHLEILDLSWNSGIGGSLSLLTSKILKGSKLHTLKLTDCCLTQEDGKSLGKILWQRDVNIFGVFTLSVYSSKQMLD